MRHLMIDAHEQIDSNNAVESLSHQNVSHSPSTKSIIESIRDDRQLCSLLKQRKTRWIEDEDKYANFLVREFEQGIAQDVPRKTTLRAYLSRKLICTPMRISKKFVGKRVGTIIFESKRFTPDLKEITIQTHLELEKKCLTALVVALNRSRSKTNDGNRNKHKFEKETTGTTNYLNALSFVPISNTQFSVASHLTKLPSTLAIDTQQKSHPSNDVILNASGRQNDRLYPPDSCSFKPICAKQMKSISIDSPSNFIAPEQHHEGKQIFDTMHQSISPNTLITARTIGVNSAYDKNLNDGCIGDIPDLVIGFDKHIASVNPNSKHDITSVLESRPSSTTWPVNSHFFAGAIEESPYITSRSFDEMHKCLGKGIPFRSPSHLDLNEAVSQTADDVPESPYITSKSFDELHCSLGNGLSSSSMSHMQFNEIKNSKPYTQTSTTINEIAQFNGRTLSAFSPIPASRAINGLRSAQCNFDVMIRRVVAPLVCDRNQWTENTKLLDRVDHTESVYDAQSGFDLATSLQSNQGFIFNINSGALDHSKAVSTSTSEHSSQSGINSSPECTDVQSD